MERKGKLEDLERSFDLQFWQAQSDAALNCLGTHCLAGSAGLLAGGASRPVGYGAEPRNQSDSPILDAAKMFPAVALDSARLKQFTSTVPR